MLIDVERLVCPGSDPELMTELQEHRGQLRDLVAARSEELNTAKAVLEMVTALGPPEHELSDDQVDGVAMAVQDMERRIQSEKLDPDDWVATKIDVARWLSMLSLGGEG